ncbi:hypothetical protein [Micromonospora sp. NPDC049102]|uniref:hypothetical protein n=1 Tax=Micromonospora sp. NPDC049102 TaxID=3364265 RepID=UPI00371ED8E3
MEIYARMSRSGLPTHLFAVHDSADVVVDSKAVFERAGADILSAEPMEVSVDTDGKLYVREPLRMESLPQFGMQRR